MAARFIYETQCRKIKIKAGCTQKVLEWFKTVNSRLDEAYEAVRKEGIVIESIFMDKTKEGDFLIFYMKAENLLKANQIIRKSGRAIDKEALKMIESYAEEEKSLDNLLDLDRIEEV